MDLVGQETKKLFGVELLQKSLGMSSILRSHFWWLDCTVNNIHEREIPLNYCFDTEYLLLVILMLLILLVED